MPELASLPSRCQSQIAKIISIHRFSKPSRKLKCVILLYVNYEMRHKCVLLKGHRNCKTGTKWGGSFLCFSIEIKATQDAPRLFFWIAFAFVSVSSLEPVQGRRPLQQVPPARAPRSVDGPLGQLACSAVTITGLYYRTKRSILQRSSLASGL